MADPIPRLRAALLQLCREVGATPRAVIKYAGDGVPIGKTWIYDLRRSTRRVPRHATVEAFLTALKRYHDRPGQPPKNQRSSIAPERFTMEALQRSFPDDFARLLGSTSDTGSREDATSASPQAPGEALRTISDWDPFDLGVHSTADLEPSLTPYILRRHDEELRRRLNLARDGGATLSILVGGSSTGKTRALYEAVAACLGRWPVLVPRDSAQLRGWIEADAIDAETVVWLDEAQRFLPAASEPLSTLLDRVRPVAVVGAMWQENWDPLLDVLEVRRLIERHRPRLTVPARFDVDQLHEANSLGVRDMRLAAAVAAAQGDGRVLQHLTGGPELVDRFENGGFSELELAVITAALDARRMGHETPIKPALLAAAAEAQLPAHQRVTDDPQWIETVLHTLTTDPGKRVVGALTALTPLRMKPGRGPADGYDPADFLDQHCRRSRRLVFPPTSFWDAAADHAQTAEDLFHLGSAAEARMRHRTAERMYRRAAARGHAYSMVTLARRRSEADDAAGAVHWAEQAAAHGHPDTLTTVADWLERSSRQEERDALYQRAIELGSSRAVEIEAISGDLTDMGKAQRLVTITIDHGNAGSAWYASYKVNAAGHPIWAARLLWLAANAKDPGAMRDAVLGLHSQGQFDEAERYATMAVDAGFPDALVYLAQRRHEQGDPVEAERLLREAADAAVPAARRELALLSERAGDFTAAERYATSAAAIGGSVALADLADLRDRAGRHGDAVRLATMAAKAGSALGLRTLALRRDEAGDHEAAESLAKQAADAGDTQALAKMAERRQNEGKFEEATRLAVLAAAAGDPYVLRRLAFGRRDAEALEDEERLAVLAAETGDPDPLRWLGERLAETGDYRVLDLAVSLGDPKAMVQSAVARDQAGDSVGALRLAMQAANAGEAWGLVHLSKRRAEEGDSVEAERLAVLAAEADNIAALDWLALSLDERVDLANAERLAILVANAGNPRTLETLAKSHRNDSARWERVLTEGL